MQYRALNTVPVHKHDFSRQDRAEHERAQLGATGNYTAEAFNCICIKHPPCLTQRRHHCRTALSHKHEKQRQHCMCNHPCQNVDALQQQSCAVAHIRNCTVAKLAGTAYLQGRGARWSWPRRARPQSSARAAQAPSHTIGPPLLESSLSAAGCGLPRRRASRRPGPCCRGRGVGRLRRGLPRCPACSAHV